MRRPIQEASVQLLGLEGFCPGSKLLTTQNSKSRTRGGFSADLQSSLWFFNHYSLVPILSLCFWAARELGISHTALAKELEMSLAGIGFSLEMGEAIAKKGNYSLET